MTPVQEKPIRILLVDDEADLVEFLAHLLLKRGYTVTATMSGAEAIEAVEAQVFDVALLDLKMPQMDGIEVLTKIREIQPYLEVIMITGHGSTNSALEAGRLNAFRYMLKPYKVEELLEQIQEAYNHREELLSSAYQKEMEKILNPYQTPHDILARSEELRRKYDRD
jgi:DNA-binding NtrC family response regulator